MEPLVGKEEVLRRLQRRKEARFCGANTEGGGAMLRRRIERIKTLEQFVATLAAQYDAATLIVGCLERGERAEAGRQALQLARRLGDELASYQGRLECLRMIEE